MTNPSVPVIRLFESRDPLWPYAYRLSLRIPSLAQFRSGRPSMREGVSCRKLVNFNRNLLFSSVFIENKGKHMNFNWAGPMLVKMIELKLK